MTAADRTRTGVARRVVAVTALAATLVVLAVAPALAHASLNVTSAPVDTDVDLTIVAPLERDSQNRRIEARFPAGFDVLSCSGPTGWLCESGASGDGTLITWEAVSIARDGDIAFKARVHTADTPGKRLIPVVQTYADGHESAWIGDGGDEPAPVLELTAANTAPRSNTATPAPHAGGSSDDDTSGGSTTAPPADEAPATDEGDGDDPATPADSAPTPDAATDAAGEDGEDGAEAATATEAEAASAAADEVDTTAPVEPTADVEETPLAAETPEGDDEGGALPLVAAALLLLTLGGLAWWWRTEGASRD